MSDIHASRSFTGGFALPESGRPVGPAPDLRNACMPLKVAPSASSTPSRRASTDVASAFGTELPLALNTPAETYPRLLGPNLRRSLIQLLAIVLTRLMIVSA